MIYGKSKISAAEPAASERIFPPWHPASHGEKVSKEDASYKKGAPNRRCGVCEYYDAHACRVVFGWIGENMVCKYFAERYEEAWNG